MSSHSLSSLSLPLYACLYVFSLTMRRIAVCRVMTPMSVSPSLLPSSSYRMASTAAAAASISHQKLVQDEFTRQSKLIEQAGGALSTRTSWYSNASWFVQSAFRHSVLAPYHRYATDNTTSAAAAATPLPSLRVLEVAAGTGILSRTLATDISLSSHARGRVAITGVDLTPAMLAQGRKAATEAGINESQLKLMEGNALALPFEDNTFDVIMTRWFLHHVPPKDVPQAIKEMARVLKHGNYSHDPSHLHYNSCINSLFYVMGPVCNNRWCCI
jgi:SAM-dependent methyltransferase